MEMQYHKYAVIVAGGSGNRAGCEIPKQFCMIKGAPMLWWSVRTFHAEDPSTKIILVLHPSYIEFWNELYHESSLVDEGVDVIITGGGKNRLESVKNGLSMIPEGCNALVAIHDAARPMITQDLVARGWMSAAKHGAAVPVDHMTDSIRFLEGNSSHAVDRSNYVRVQTPQVFDFSLLKAAYDSPLYDSMTDDASVVEAYGHDIVLYAGESSNIKVTNPFDFKIAELLIQ